MATDRDRAETCPNMKVEIVIKLPIASHTFLDTYTRCPKQAYHKFVAKDVPYVESDAMKWGNEVHAALEQRVGRHKTRLPEKMLGYEKYAVVFDSLPVEGTELKLGMARDGKQVAFFDNATVFLRGKVDVLVLKDNTAFLADWKTGKKREDPTELEEHALLVKARWPQVDEITGAYVWLKDDEMGRVHDLSDVAKTYGRVVKTMRSVEQTIAAGIKWPANENPLCGWCEVPCRFNPRFPE